MAGAHNECMNLNRQQQWMIDITQYRIWRQAHLPRIMMLLRRIRPNRTNPLSLYPKNPSSCTQSSDAISSNSVPVPCSGLPLDKRQVYTLQTKGSIIHFNADLTITRRLEVLQGLSHKQISSCPILLLQEKKDHSGAEFQILIGMMSQKSRVLKSGVSWFYWSVNSNLHFLCVWSELTHAHTHGNLFQWAEVIIPPHPMPNSLCLRSSKHTHTHPSTGTYSHSCTPPTLYANLPE